MNAKPKPTWQQRQEEKQKRLYELTLYRSRQVKLAMERDNARCVFCWFLLGIDRPMDDVHHVYGRGREAGDWREHHTKLVCTCRKHHPAPIMSPRAFPELAYVEGIMERANEEPINPDFVEPEEEKEEEECGD